MTGVWVGLPRSVLGFWAMAYCNATLIPHAPGGWWLGVVLIPLMALATSTYLPFPSHRIARKHRLGFYVVATIFFTVTIAALVFKPTFFFDVMFFFMAGYSASAWMTLAREERLEFKNVVSAARGSVTAARVDTPRRGRRRTGRR